MNSSFRALQLKARRQVYTLLSGHNLSKLHGEGYDFAELREYQVGDDIRKINWTITAKLGRPYIKELHANRELSVALCCLMDGSLYFGKDNAKQRTLSETAMLLAYAVLHGGDLFTGIACTQEGIEQTPPTKQLFTVERYLEHLYTTPLLHTALNRQAALEQLFGRLHQRSLLFLLDDFLDEIDLSLLAQKHEVIAIIIRHREEEVPKALGEVVLQNPRNGAMRETFFAKRSIIRYTANRQAHDEKMAAHFSRYGIRHLTIFTDEPPLEKLLTLFR